MNTLAALLLTLGCTQTWIGPSYEDGAYKATIDIQCTDQTLFNREKLEQYIMSRDVLEIRQDDSRARHYTTQTHIDGEIFTDFVFLSPNYYSDTLDHSTLDNLRGMRISMLHNTFDKDGSGTLKYLLISAFVEVHRPWYAPTSIFMGIAKDKHAEKLEQELHRLLYRKE